MNDQPKRPLPAARVHPDDRARLEGGNTLAKLAYGAPEARAPISYYSPILLRCTLPHSDPKVRDWKRTNGDYTLVVSSGVDDELEPHGIPYGSFPRLVLAYIITRVRQSRDDPKRGDAQDRRVELATHFTSFLNDIGYKGNHKGNGKKGQVIRQQLVRLLQANISFKVHQAEQSRDGVVGGAVRIADQYYLWWDAAATDQKWGTWIELSADFYDAILDSPMPLYTHILAGLKKSPLALDLYMWLSLRLYAMNVKGDEYVSIPYSQLSQQFGTCIGESNYRYFRHVFKKAMGKVALYWEEPNDEGLVGKLKYDLEETHLVLYRSSLLINPSRATQAEEQARAILTKREFDPMTMRRARTICGGFDVKVLQILFFEWVEREHITPHDPVALFYQFIRTHRERNGEKP